MPKIEPFEKYSQRYENWFENNKFAYQSELLAVKKIMPKDGEGIEIGVGSGRFAELLGIKLGVEPSPKMRKIAEKKGIKVIDAVAEKLPFDDEQFDFALMVTTICFLDDIEIAFKEAYRILKPDGSLIIGFVDKNSSLGKFYLKNKTKSVFYELADFYSTDEVVFYLKRADFKIFAFVQTIFRNFKELESIEPVKKGYGKGSFVVIKAMKGDVSNG
ncbi:MAG: class I SAM-dependent methyltransferase [Candidatus Ratteibacteria bacterium]|nr:class I SAM-dependent methyltransferase [Candidatus Ratteibacteria bacterium]